jgi:hypothetical protein
MLYDSTRLAGMSCLPITKEVEVFFLSFVLATIFHPSSFILVGNPLLSSCAKECEITLNWLAYQEERSINAVIWGCGMEYIIIRPCLGDLVPFTTKYACYPGYLIKHINELSPAHVTNKNFSWDTASGSSKMLQDF